MILAKTLLLASSAVALDALVSTNGPFSEFTEDEYAAFFDSRETRNATGLVYFDGYNVSESFPPNDTISDWAARIEVGPINGDDETYTGTRIWFDPPDNITLPGNESDWNTCIVAFPPDWLKSKVRGKVPDGQSSCSFLSDECESALKRVANSYYWDGESCTGNPSLPAECEDDGEDDDSEIYSFGSSDYSSTFNRSTLIAYRADPSSDADDDESYDIQVGGYWTLLVNWGRRDPQSFESDEVPQGSVLCLKADMIEEGSESAAVKLLVGAGMTLFTSLLATVWLT